MGSRTIEALALEALLCRRKKWLMGRLRFLKFLREQNQEHNLYSTPTPAKKRLSEAEVSQTS